MSDSAQQILEKLTEARQAYHDLVTGVKPRVVVDSNGDRVEFVAANSQKLYAYVNSLQAEYDALISTASNVPSNAPLRFLF